MIGEEWPALKAAYERWLDALEREAELHEANQNLDLALRIGNPSASRAVGLANGRNPLPIVVPRSVRPLGGGGRMRPFGTRTKNHATDSVFSSSTGTRHSKWLPR